MRALLFLSLLLAACAPVEDRLGEGDGGLLGAGEPMAIWEPSMLRARSTWIDVDLALGEASPEDDVVTPSELSLTLFDDVTYRARLERIVRGRRGVSWVGRIDEPPGEVVLSVVDRAYAGTVRVDGRLFQLNHLRGREHVLIERDEALIPGDTPLLPEGMADAGGLVGPSQLAPPPAADGGTEVDVLVVYTKNALIGAGSTAGIEAQIELAVAETNIGYTQSGVDMHIRLVATAGTFYDEAGFDISQTLGRLQGSADGFMDEVHALRDQHGADHVVLLVETAGPYAGMGYQLLAPFVPFFDAYAFSVVSRSYATGAYTFGHELGHNMGATHDHDNATTGFDPWSFGLQVPGSGYRTIMAYSCAGCVRVNHWSNPEISHAGAPTGVDGWADNARTLSTTRTIAAAFRPTVVVEAKAAEMISPTPGSMLPSGVVAFSWTDADALAYQLTLGDAPGDNAWFDMNVGGALGVDVSGLPETGEMIHARLWTLTSSEGWKFIDYVYQTHLEPDYGATLVFPQPSSVLGATALPFFWWDSGAAGYRLQVGTLSSPGLYFDAELGAQHWAYVAGLPHQGSGVIAKLSAHGPAGDAVSSAKFAGYTAPSYAATLQKPSKGSTLPSTSATFKWSSSKGATGYWLVLRNDDGSVIQSHSAKKTKLALHGLPSDGRPLVATLYTNGASGWAETSTTFFAAAH